MSSLSSLLDRFLKDPFKILSVFAVLFAIIVNSGLRLGPLAKIGTAVLGVVILILVLMILTKVTAWYRSRPGVRIFLNSAESPAKYRVENTLDHLAQHQDMHLEIIARTCFRWLCGDETKLIEDPADFREQQRMLQDKLRVAVQKGSTIHFVLQNPKRRIPYFNDQQNERLHHHGQLAIESFEIVLQRLTEHDRARFNMSFIDDVVENSMTRLVEKSHVARLIFDISIRFKSTGHVSKPFLLFESSGNGIDEFKQEFEHLLSLAIPKSQYDQLSEYEQKVAEGKQAADAIIESYKFHSRLRKDESRTLAKVLARHYLATTKPELTQTIPPPVSVQLLVTNECTTKCQMCSHHLLHTLYGQDEMNDDEIRYTLEYIRDIGTRNIIISGGEPLARSRIWDILRYSRQIGLNVGLLTNGVKRDGATLSRDEALVLRETCSWVQLSIDSFNPETYKAIRHYDYCQKVLESLNVLVEVGVEGIEVCMTIQKDNIDELTTGVDRILQAVPPSVPIRCKFAHGPVSGQDFLFSDEQLRKLLLRISRTRTRLNFDYLMTMMEKGYFDREGLLKGRPLEKKMRAYQSQGYRCHALRLTCKIDANGDVYPCCFLFDDNNARSSMRSKYKIGSLRSENTGLVKPLDYVRASDGSCFQLDNPLTRIWQSNEALNSLRNQILPVDAEACSYCTRHFYQNEYLNQLYGAYSKYDRFGIAERFAQEGETSAENMWV
jgi:MoaA/NifB/PqqE/SkfB family radical SAM enzyme